jgi:hypothetical protein
MVVYGSRHHPRHTGEDRCLGHVVEAPRQLSKTYQHQHARTSPWTRTRWREWVLIPSRSWCLRRTGRIAEAGLVGCALRTNGDW